MTSIEHPEQAAGLLGIVPSLQRLLLWGLATISLLPLGREGPVVQVGASAALWFRRVFPRWLGGISHADLLAVAGGAGLAGGFNTPLLGVVFVAEEFMGTFSTALIWPALVVGALAAAFSSLVGQPEFALGMVGVAPGELDQLLWAIPLGALAGGLGALFARLLLRTTRRWRQLSVQRPLSLGLAVGGLLSVFLLLSGGAAGCDGELLMTAMINGSSPTTTLLPGVFGDLFTLVLRVVGPVLALSTAIPGGLIDPSFAFGAVLGHSLGDLAAAPQLGLTLGMVAGLAGATQLPVLAVLFGVRMAGDQQLLPGLLLSAVVAAYVSRCLVEKPVYHALKDIADEPMP
jgi:H+/Cl- antiporter ClcA